ncbi:MAG: hypothetical protein IJ853_00815 [Rickettsiales bacterium]|nr:hypothetical protein [Rickettsiales bacterium]
MTDSNEKNNKANKKLILLKRAIKILPIFIFIALLCYATSDFFILEHIKNNIKLRDLDVDANKIVSKTREVDRKTSLIKNYINTWNNDITETQKMPDGINIESLKVLFTDMAKKYMIKSIDISFSVPRRVEIDGNTLNVMGSEISLSFNCLTEYSVYHFINELYKNDYGFFIIEEMEIRKIRNIDKNVIRMLVENGDANALSVNMKLQWYELSSR